jgi:transposase-like protein
MENDGRRYPERKQRELTEEEKEAIRSRIQGGDDDIYRLAAEFGCTTSQVAGIKAALHR